MSDFATFVAVERVLHLKRMRFAGLMVALIVCVLYRIDWTLLRPGLVVLLAGQAGVVAALITRNIAISNMRVGPLDAVDLQAWFKAEESFVRWLAIFENGCQIVGFLILGYGLWLVTRSSGLALLSGIVYPVSVYFGVTRKRNVAAIRRLRLEREKV